MKPKKNANTKIVQANMAMNIHYVSLCVYVYVYIYIYIFVYLLIICLFTCFLFIERERERQISSHNWRFSRKNECIVESILDVFG